MTRDLYLFGLSGLSFINLCYQPNYVSILAFAISLLSALVVMYAPALFDSKADQLRADLGRELAEHEAKIQTLTERIDVLMLGGRR